MQCGPWMHWYSLLAFLSEEIQHFASPNPPLAFSLDASCWISTCAKNPTFWLNFPFFQLPPVFYHTLQCVKLIFSFVHTTVWLRRHLGLFTNASKWIVYHKKTISQGFDGIPSKLKLIENKEQTSDVLSWPQAPQVSKPAFHCIMQGSPLILLSNAVDQNAYESVKKLAPSLK